MREKKYIHIQRGLTGKNNPDRNLCELIEKGRKPLFLIFPQNRM